MCSLHNDMESDVRRTELIKEYRKLVDDYLYARYKQDSVWMGQINRQIRLVLKKIGTLPISLCPKD